NRLFADTGMEAADHQLLRLRVRFHGAEIRDHLDGALRSNPQPGTSVAARAVADGRHEIDAFDHSALRVWHHDEDTLAADRHVGRAARTWQSNRRRRIGTDH